MDERLQRLKNGEQLQKVVEKFKRRYLQKKQALDLLQNECNHEIGVCLGNETWDEDYDWVDDQINICLFCGKRVGMARYIINVPKECENPEMYLKQLQKKCVAILDKEPNITFEEFLAKLRELLREQK